MSSFLGHWFIAESNIWTFQEEKGSATGGSSQHQIPTSAKKDIQITGRIPQRKSPMAPNPIKLANLLVIFFLKSHPVLHAVSLCHYGNLNNNIPPCPLALLPPRPLGLLPSCRAPSLLMNSVPPSPIFPSLSVLPPSHLFPLPSFSRLPYPHFLSPLPSSPSSSFSSTYSLISPFTCDIEITISFLLLYLL